MGVFKINNNDYKISKEYKAFRSKSLNSLSSTTKELLLDYTIMWNMVEHFFYDDSFSKNEKTDKCINKVLSNNESLDKIIYIYDLFKEYIYKYSSEEEIYYSFKFNKSRIELVEIKKLLNSDNISDKLRLLIYSCYRVRCNLFHGPKCIFDLNNQNLLFLTMNELLSLILNSWNLDN